MKAGILIIDDEEKLSALLKRLIALEGYNVFTAPTLAAGMKVLERETIDVLLCDVKLPDGNGVDAASVFKNKYPLVEIILLTAYGNIQDGIQAMKNGAFDYLVKGDENHRIIPLIGRAVEKIMLRGKVAHFEKQLGNKHSFDIVIGDSPAIMQAIQLAKKVAPSNASVLLTGETGTGKEVFAEIIHYNSSRSAGPFVALNCSALSKEIIESELFGHVSGAFTGAVKDKKGLIEEASGGTLFLDEIGEMPLELQPKLLRFLENNTFYKVGDTTQRTADVRLIVATNRDLQAEISENKFRSDLYYRIAVFSIRLPSLKERPADIPLLARHFLQVYAPKTNKQIISISHAAVQALVAHHWPGNVRELKNVMERAVILEDTAEITLSSLPFELQIPSGPAVANDAIFHLSFVEKLHIQKMLNYTKGNKTETARLLNIGLATLYRKIEEYHLK